MIKTLALCLVLGGCAGAPPQALWVNDEVQYTSDYLRCSAGAANYHQGLSGEDILSSGLEGGLQQAPAGMVNPLIPAVGASAGAGEAVVGGLDLIPKAKSRVWLHCMEALTLRDGSATMADPN